MSEQCTARPQLQGSAHSLAMTLTSLVQAIECRSQQLALQKREFAGLVADVQTLNAWQAQCVYLDVGGTHFHAGHEALQRHGPHYLSALTSCTFAAPEDATGYIFVDRDPQWFALVLAYLRDRALYRPSDRAALRGLQRETVFYALPELRRHAHLEEVLLAITVQGGHLHAYDAGAGRWRRLRDPLRADRGVVVEFSSHWNERLVVLVMGAATGAWLELLDVDAWAWQRVPLPGNFYVLTAVQWGERLVLLVEWPDGTMELQALDAALSWQTITLPFMERYMPAEIFCVQGRLLVLTAPQSRQPQRNCLRVYEGDGWRALPAMANAMEMFSMCQLEDRVVVIGGPSSVPGLGAFEFRWGKGLWEALPPLPQHQHSDHFEMKGWQGKVMVMGRRLGADPSVDAYDVATGRWVAWPSPRYDVSHSVVHDDVLYMCGPAGSLEQYDPQRHGWRQTWHFHEEVLVESLRLPKRLVWSDGAELHAADSASPNM